MPSCRKQRTWAEVVITQLLIYSDSHTCTHACSHRDTHINNNILCLKWPRYKSTRLWRSTATLKPGNMLPLVHCCSPGGRWGRSAAVFWVALHHCSPGRSTQNRCKQKKKNQNRIEQYGTRVKLHKLSCCFCCWLVIIGSRGSGKIKVMWLTCGKLWMCR